MTICLTPYVCTTHCVLYIINLLVLLNFLIFFNQLFSSLFVITDLQLAAELGKTLLERNKELEAQLKLQQTVIEDREQEIEVSIFYKFHNLFFKKCYLVYLTYSKSI